MFNTTNSCSSDDVAKQLAAYRQDVVALETKSSQEVEVTNEVTIEVADDPFHLKRRSLFDFNAFGEGSSQGVSSSDDTQSSSTISEVDNSPETQTTTDAVCEPCEPVENVCQPDIVFKP